jgi:threonine synthase
MSGQLLYALDVEKIQFMSTRIPSGLRETQAEPVAIESAIVAGMPRDGGLYVPTSFPNLPSRVFDTEPLGYAELAYLVLAPYFNGWERSELFPVLEAAYKPGEPNLSSGEAYFDTEEIAPLRHLRMRNGGRFLLELYHGRTCAFKDLALSVMGGFMRVSRNRLGEKNPMLILAATSGDTGSATLEGFVGVDGVKVAVIYPHGGTSEIQRLQMTTVPRENRFVAAIHGNFDDAQRAVKSIFSRASGRQGPLASFTLSSANSINIGRLLPQIVYYVKAWRDLAFLGALGEDGMFDIAVPTGNFGDILAAYYAKRMGLPIGKLICASNSNRVLADFFRTGTYDRRRELVKTESPSMDILVSSNLERLIFAASGESRTRTTKLMGMLAAQGYFSLDKSERDFLVDFEAGWADDEMARSEIAKVWKDERILVDPHTAVALSVAESVDSSRPMVVVSTASPFKFPSACLEAIGASNGNLTEFRKIEILERFSGQNAPRSIRALCDKPILHDKVLDVRDLETELAAFVFGKAGS